MTKDEIRAELDRLGIDHDGRASKEDLEALLPKAESKGTVTCRVLRDYWPTDNQQDRVRKGTIVELEPMAALDGVESGSLERVK